VCNDAVSEYFLSLDPIGLAAGFPSLDTLRNFELEVELEILRNSLASILVTAS
jgi:hypothetical protein